MKTSILCDAKENHFYTPLSTTLTRQMQQLFYTNQSTFTANIERQ
jgi:hypothetical protein